MVHVAVAGAGPGLGMSVVNGLLEGNHSVTILSRKSPSSDALQHPNLKYAQVSYDDHQSLTSALKSVHTVISTIGSFDMLTPQVALLKASVEAGVKRFIPSEWAGQGACNAKVKLYNQKDVMIEKIKETGIEYTTIRNGIFTNYFATGSPKGQDKALYGLPPLVLNLSIAEDWALIPGTGDNKVAFTRVEDVGRFVAEIVRFEKWETEYRVCGDLKSYNEIVKIAEDTTGRKIKRTYNPISYYENNDNKPSEFMEAFMFEIYKCVTEDLAGYEPNVDSKTVKDVMGVEEFIQKWWGA